MGVDRSSNHWTSLHRGYWLLSLATDWRTSDLKQAIRATGNSRFESQKFPRQSSKFPLSRARFSLSRALFRKNVGALPNIRIPPDWIHTTTTRTVTVCKASIASWQHLTWHFMTPAGHTKSLSYYYFNYLRHVATSQKFACPLVGAPFCGGSCSAEHAEHA